MANPDINAPRISNEIRTDAPWIGHGSGRNQTGDQEDEQKNLDNDIHL
jgi:hypothetical protein